VLSLNGGTPVSVPGSVSGRKISHFYDTSDHILVKLQRALNTLARVVTFTKRMDHIRPDASNLFVVRPARQHINEFCVKLNAVCGLKVFLCD